MKTQIIETLLNVLQADHPVMEVRVCCHWTAVVSRGCGLASTFLSSEPHHAGSHVRDAGKLHRKTARELAEYALSANNAEASIGIAAMNSLLTCESPDIRETNAIEEVTKLGIGRRCE